MTRREPAEYRERRVKVRVDLRHFWTLHEYFRRFVNLFELRQRPTDLLVAMRAVFEHRPLYPSVRRIAEGYLAMPQIANDLKCDMEPLLRRFPHARTLDDLITAEMAEIEERPIDAIQISRPIASPERGLSNVNIETLPFDSDEMMPSTRKGQLKVAMWLLSIELNEVLGDRQARWVAEGEALRLRIPPPTSLWEMIWQLFAADTTSVSWRICPHCQELFYPPRTDRYYCTSRQQILASKREWARHRRGSTDLPRPTGKEKSNERL